MIPGVCQSFCSFCWAGTERMTILMVPVLTIQPKCRVWARGQDALHFTVHVISAASLLAPQESRESLRGHFFQRNKEGKDECTCLISYRQLNMSSFPLPLIPNLQPLEQKSRTAISWCMIPISLCLYNMVPALLQPLGIRTSEMSQKCQEGDHPFPADQSCLPSQGSTLCHSCHCPSWTRGSF